VKAHPILIRKARFILLFLQDITEQERKAGLERAFFHDLINVIMGIQGAAQLMALEKGRRTREWSERIGRMAARLQAEVAIQHALSQAAPGKYIPPVEEMSVAGLVEELREIVSHHLAARNKCFAVRTPLPRRRLKTNVSLLLRVLGNMLTNAFEATEEGGRVRFWAEAGRKATRFCVWNRAAIGPEVSPRVFQRYFSTKPGNGRGIGSFTMKLLGEEYLGGVVDFTSSAAGGTVFRITLPQ
jgi:signal transduction histidine kinase